MQQYAKHIPYEDRAHVSCYVCGQSGRIRVDEKIDDTEGMTTKEVDEMMEDKQAKANAQILEMVGSGYSRGGRAWSIRAFSKYFAKYSERLAKTRFVRQIFICYCIL